MADQADTCSALTLKSACTATLHADSICADETLIPWNYLFVCTAESLEHDAIKSVAFVAGLVLLTLMVMWIGVNLMSKNAEMYFAPALEDLCLKWNVPSRTAAALFVALANGAPDLASTGYMFKQGQGDMAFGALLGASTYVCMNVIGMIIQLPPSGPMPANPAVVRDIAGYLVLLLCLLPIFTSGLSRSMVIILNSLYAGLTVLIFIGDEWHKRGRPRIFRSSGSEDAFQALIDEDDDDTSDLAHEFHPLEHQPPPAAHVTLTSYVQESSRRMQEQHESRMHANRHALASSEPAPAHNLASARGWNGSGQSLDNPSAARQAAAAVGEWDVSDAISVERETARATSGQLSASASASGDMSLMITPGDSVSQQRGAPPKPPRGGTDPNLGSIPLELETAMPVRHATSWAVNDSMRVLGMLFPPCGDGAAADEEPGESWEGTAETGQLQNGGSPGGGRNGIHIAAAAVCMPVVGWFSAALEVPDYVEFVAQPMGQRHALHGTALLLMAPVMALMRFTIPTIAADFYEAGVFLVSAMLAPLVAGPLYGLEMPTWLTVALMLVAAGTAAVFLTFGGFGIPKWIQGQGIVPRLCVLAFSAVTLFMAVGWIQLVAGELVGCMQALGNVVKCPTALLGFALAAINSLGDQATNLSLARTSGKRAAFAACFSGMTFNLCIASAYGWFLYTQKYNVATVPLQISLPTWILYTAMVLFLICMLCVVACVKTATGNFCIPQAAGRWCQMTFLVLLIGFVAGGIVQWSGSVR
eukprot:jgi/Ulvmu1/5041/UM021_0058.1